MNQCYRYAVYHALSPIINTDNLLSYEFAWNSGRQEDAEEYFSWLVEKIRRIDGLVLDLDQFEILYQVYKRCNRCGKCDMVLEKTRTVRLIPGQAFNIGVCGDSSDERCLICDGYAPSSRILRVPVNNTRSISVTRSILRLPRVLVIQLARNTFRWKDRTPVEYPLELQVKDRVYRLVSVIVHKGRVDYGHYTTFNRRGDGWFHCDDLNVRPSSLNEALSQQEDAYLLFYTR